MFTNIERFYKDNHYKLLENREQNSLRPGKSFAKDPITCIEKFVNFAKDHSENIINDSQLAQILGQLEANTKSQNLRTMREFGFLEEISETETEKRYRLTELFYEFISSGIETSQLILKKLETIKSMEDITMYINLLMCTLREAYNCGEIILFPDAIDKFKSKVPDPIKRTAYRQRIFEIYGYCSRDMSPADDTYSPNLTYMSRYTLEALDLVTKTAKKIDGMDNLVLTINGYKLLETINNNLSFSKEDTSACKTYDFCKFQRNRIFFGAPGTGKSFEMNKECKRLLENSDNNNQDGYERVTFHPNYTYANFVGTYKPVKKDADDITYEYVPGPFMRVYLKALINQKKFTFGIEPLKPYVLLIEEINRANVAAVFGDVFQLLDRNAHGESEYSIDATEDLKKYLKEKLIEQGFSVEEDDYSQIKLPSNMFIWATMNSADQGVFPMDTAFKRRWEFEYIGIDEKVDDDLKNYKIPIQYGTFDEKPVFKYVGWNDLRKKINDILSKDCHVNEDKLLGPYFVTKVVLENALKDDTTKKQFIKAFESKVLMYLFEDAVKMHPARIFRGCNAEGLRYSEVCSAFENTGIEIFGKTDLTVSDN